MIEPLTSGNMRDMQLAGKVSAKVLSDLKSFIKPGISTRDIELFFNEALGAHSGMRASFKGYGGYPATICVSVNDEVIHGIPSPDRIIQNGDLVSVDLGIEYNGVNVDSAYTYAVGEISKEAQLLCKVTYDALWEGIKKARAGMTVGDIGSTIEVIAQSNDFSVVRQFVGHGIGKKLHLPPEVPNFGKPASGFKLYAGIALAIEPMINAGSYEVDILRDGWTVRTKDRSLSAHFEHTVIVTGGEPLVVT